MTHKIEIYKGGTSSPPLHVMFRSWLQSLRPDQRAFADTSHLPNQSIAFARIQQLQRQLNLCVSIFAWSAIPKVRILTQKLLCGLSSLNNGTAFIFRKSKHHGQNEISCQGVFYKPHIQYMNTDTTLKQISDSLNAFNRCARESIQLGNYQSILRCKFR